MTFRKRFLSHVFLIYANREDSVETLILEHVCSDVSDESVLWNRLAGAYVA